MVISPDEAHPFDARSAGVQSKGVSRPDRETLDRLAFSATRMN
jgi:hypothetical protein